MLKICAQTLELWPGPQLYDATQNVFLRQLKVLEEQLKRYCPASHNNGHVGFYIQSQLLSRLFAKLVMKSFHKRRDTRVILLVTCWRCKKCRCFRGTSCCQPFHVCIAISGIHVQHSSFFYILLRFLTSNRYVLQPRFTSLLWCFVKDKWNGVKWVHQTS